MRFDPKIIHEMAESMYSQADMSEIVYGLVGVLIGASIGWAAAAPLGAQLLGIAIGGLLLGGVGYWIGHQRATMLRLIAQLMLVGTKIEENTRPASQGAWVPHPSKETRSTANRISDALGK